MLRIDEFKCNSGKEKYQVIIADSNEKKVIDILQTRKLNNLKKYYEEIDKESRDNVKIFVSDMWILTEQ